MFREYLQRRPLSLKALKYIARPIDYSWWYSKGGFYKEVVWQAPWYWATTTLPLPMRRIYIVVGRGRDWTKGRSYAHMSMCMCNKCYD